MTARILSGVAMLAFVVCIGGCAHDRDLRAPKQVTRVEITGLNMRFIKRIKKQTDIAAIVQFAANHRSGWTQPWAGVPVAQLYAYFYDGHEVLGHFAVGPGFFETDLAGDNFRSRNASKSETDAFLALIGMQGARFE